MKVRELKSGEWGLVETAWAEYWNLINEVKLSLQFPTNAARQYVHDLLGKVKTRKKEPSPDECVLHLMRKVKNFRNKKVISKKEWNKMCKDKRNWFENLKTAKTVDAAFDCMGVARRDDIVAYLAHADRFDLLEQLKSDAIFGPEATIEIRINDCSIKFDEYEKDRQAALPDKMKELTDLLNKSEFLLAIFYPHVHENHSIPNCATVMREGFPIFRLEVLDDPTFNKFRYVELKNRTNSQAMDAFRINGVVENDVIDFEKLKEIITALMLFYDLGIH